MKTILMVTKDTYIHVWVDLSNSVNLIYTSIYHEFKVKENVEETQEVIYFTKQLKSEPKCKCHPRQTLTYSVHNSILTAFSP